MGFKFYNINDQLISSLPFCLNKQEMKKSQTNTRPRQRTVFVFQGQNYLTLQNIKRILDTYKQQQKQSIIKEKKKSKFKKPTKRKKKNKTTPALKTQLLFIFSFFFLPKLPLR
jgi:D-alanyl-lipoteichoic acid acyltransferase DltB (MBOAT superfamily)